MENKKDISKVVKPIANDTQLLNRQISDLQDNISIDKDGKVTGTSKYVQDFKDFSTLADEQKGNYLALQFQEAIDGREVKVGIRKQKKLDSDGQIILILKDGKTKPIKVTVDGDETYELDLSGLTISPAI